MSRKYFGTDGVRGRVGQDPMTADFAMRLASAAARVLVPQGGTVLIGKDTRLSGYMFESALEAGFVAAGADVLLLGPLPTPGIAMLTQEFDADLGVVISASHNPFFDNGIKFFDKNGAKLSDDVEQQIEEYLAQPAITLESSELGKAKRIDTARIRYEEFAASTMPEGLTLEGLKIVFDGANGAGYKVGPRTLARLGAEVIPIGCSPNGKNINDACGSTQPDLLCLTVPAVKADVGVGAGRRRRPAGHGRRERRNGGWRPAAVHSGEFAHGQGRTERPGRGYRYEQPRPRARPEAARDIEFHRAQVGDRYVLETLRKEGGKIGGETSGHMLMLDKTTTGDGLVCGLQVLAIMKETGKKLSELAAGMPSTRRPCSTCARKSVWTLTRPQRCARPLGRRRQSSLTRVALCCGPRAPSR